MHLGRISNVRMIFAYIIDRNIIDKVRQFYIFCKLDESYFSYYVFRIRHNI